MISNPYSEVLLVLVEGAFVFFLESEHDSSSWTERALSEKALSARGPKETDVSIS
jgi:hypothetical protein